MRHPFRKATILALTLSVFAVPALLAQEATAQTEPTPTPAPEQLTPEQQAAAKEASVLDDKKLGEIATDFKALYRMAEFCEPLEPCVPVVRKVVEQNLDLLREPRTDGTYRWASFQRIEAGRVSLEKEILKVHSEATPDILELTGRRAYSVVVNVPKKRSLVSANNKIYVRDVVAETTGIDGKAHTTEIPVGVWVNPGDAHTVPLDDIAISARVKVALGVESGTKKGVASVALLEAGLVDDPLNPFYPATKRLVALSAIAKEKNVSRAQLKSVSQEAVLELPGEMEKMMKIREIGIKRMRQMAESGQAAGAIAVGDATPDVIHELDKASKLLAGTVAEQEEGRKALESLIQTLSPPPPPAPPTN